MATEILSPEAFAEKVQAYGNKQVQLIAQKAALAVYEEIYRNILILTPVLTGHARYNWQSSINNPLTDEIEGVAGVTETGASVTGEEASELDDIKKAYLGAPLGSALWIANGVPYIQRLENGWSGKAPAGMVLPAINASLAVLKDKKLNLT